MSHRKVMSSNCVVEDDAQQERPRAPHHGRSVARWQR